ncbi:hypothetical protein LTR17_007336 [Elasticomyces elasticus]|nr:hypothetical protein LTR17_007336 [Elasticomyces elasticus]
MPDTNTTMNMASTIDEVIDLASTEALPGDREIDTTLTVEDLTRRYVEKQRIWAGSDERTRTARQPANGWQLTEAICLGTGSFSEVWDNGYDGAGISMLQLAAFMDVVTYLQQTSRVPIRILIQDPCYYEVDSAFLESLGITPSVCHDWCGSKDEIPDGLDALESISGSSFICELGIETNESYMRKVIELTPALMIASGPPTLAESRAQEERIVQGWAGMGPVWEASAQIFQDYSALRYEWIERYEAAQLEGRGGPGIALGSFCVFTRLG